MSINISRIRIWDRPVRLFHWGLILLVALSFASGKSGAWTLHYLSGYAILTLVLFRILWGILGSENARFVHFLKSPLAAARQLGRLTKRDLDTETSHNPAGGWAVLGLLALMLLAVLSGWWAYQAGAPDMAGEAHEVLSHALLILIALHVLAVVATGFKHRENLVRAMWTGRKRALPEQGIGSSHVLTGLLLFAAVTWLGWALYAGLLPGLTT